ncbi:MAG TPA: AraC family transcriptional regulator [Cytophagales bacterium]|jgi:AraC-like DNA-binding protein|nr:AraC family transcriptional regulator [Cytophagales bacterium]
MHSIIETSQTKIHSQGTIQVLFEKDDFSLSISENTSKKTEAIDTELHKNIIHFYFCVEGSAVFAFGPHYSREITNQKNYFFYNPEKNLTCQIQLAPRTKMVMMAISLESMHKLFVNDVLPFLKAENVNQKFYDEREIPPHLLLVLNQLFNTQLSESASRLFYHGKAYEILSLYFSERKPNTENCPFLNDQETVRKIKHAKEHLLKNAEAPPNLKELAKFAGLNEYQLKAGFKEIYGNSVFGYLLDHKLDHARVLLDTKKHKVNEVAYQLGYTNPSHFIAAFKKKFGMTPKKYLMGKN